MQSSQPNVAARGGRGPLQTGAAPGSPAAAASNSSFQGQRGGREHGSGQPNVAARGGRRSKASAMAAADAESMGNELTVSQLEGRQHLLEVLQRQAEEAKAAFEAASHAFVEATTQANEARKAAAEAERCCQQCERERVSRELRKKAFAVRIEAGQRVAHWMAEVQKIRSEMIAAEARASRARVRQQSAESIPRDAPRPELASYGGWPLVGGLKAAVRDAEFSTKSRVNLRLTSANGGGKQKQARDKFPFYYVMNPPRHGKSLFLDLLFRSHQGVVVSPTSYNVVDDFRAGELASAKSCWHGFQARVAWSILGGEFQDRGEEWSDFDMKYSDWPKNLIILVDEFSNVTDKFTDEEAKKSLYGFMWNIMKATQGRIYMTGFNRGPANQAVASNFAVITTSLPQCEPSESEKLGLVLYHLHGEARFPYFIYEVCKSTPGLLGTLANIVAVHKEMIRDDMSSFLFGEINWIRLLVDNAATYWPLVARVMQGDETALDEAEAHALTVLDRNGQPALSPFAVAVIVTFLKRKDCNTNLELLESLHNCVNICKLRRSGKTRNIKALPPEDADWVQKLKEEIDLKPKKFAAPKRIIAGKTFELFTAQAMHARLLCGGILLRECDLVVRVFVPRNAKGSTYLPPVDIQLHILADQSGLEELLGAVPYALFPCGYELLSTPSDDSTERPKVAFKRVTVLRPTTCDPPKRYYPAGAVDTKQLGFFPGVLPDAPMPALCYGQNQSPFVELAPALAVADYIIDSVKWCVETNKSFIAVPMDPCNAYCDVVAILASDDGYIDIAMVECRDRRQMRIEGYLEKVRKLAAARTLIHDLDLYFAGSPVQGKLRWRYVLAGRCDQSPSAAEMAEALAS